ncbi:MAG: hypothetical protein KDK36_19795 [Leptospiraceae bacterium]|nr:hypothetical protein [Leptospiraceae bacterium]
MGNGENGRIRLEAEDFPLLEKMTIELREFVVPLFPLKVIEDSAFPYRYEYKHSEENSFEFIFSSMGSFTVRISKNERYKRNPPPIFYISVGKYSSSEYIWEEQGAVPFSVEPDRIKQSILQSIHKFVSSALS